MSRPGVVGIRFAFCYRAHFGYGYRREEICESPVSRSVEWPSRLRLRWRSYRTGLHLLIPGALGTYFRLSSRDAQFRRDLICR